MSAETARKGGGWTNLADGSHRDSGVSFDGGGYRYQRPRACYRNNKQEPKRKWKVALTWHEAAIRRTAKVFQIRRWSISLLWIFCFLFCYLRQFLVLLWMAIFFSERSRWFTVGAFVVGSSFEPDILVLFYTELAAEDSARFRPHLHRCARPHRIALVDEIPDSMHSIVLWTDFCSHTWHILTICYLCSLNLNVGEIFWALGIIWRFFFFGLYNIGISFVTGLVVIVEYEK